MAEDDIVQKVIIEVDDTALAKVGDTAQTSFNKLETAAGSAGSSMQAAQAAVDQVRSGAQKLPAVLDQVAEKTVVTTRQMRAMGTVMRVVGEGAAASVATGFVKIGAALGPIGIALFAAAEAFSFLKGKMKEAEDQAKATIATMAGIAKIGAEIEAEPPPAGPQPFTGAGVAYVGPLTEQAPTKETANNYRAVAEQLKNIAAGSGAVISELTSAATLTKAFVVELKDAGISVNDVMADTKKLGEESYKASLQAAKIYEKMSPLERLDFEKVLASLGFPPETIASIEKGTAALKQARAEAEASSWENWAPAFRKIGDAIQSAAQAAGAFFSEFGRAAGAFLADFGQRLVDAVNLSVQQVKDAFNGVVSAISNAFNAILSPIQTVLTTIGGWINALLGKAQALVSVIGGLMGGGGSSGGGDGGSGYATGGVVSGAPGVDRNLAYLSAGEFVMRVAAVQKFGLPFMHSINALAAPRFAGGGLNAGGGLSAALAGSSGRPIHLHIDGRSFGPLTAPEGVASALERFSVHAQLSSAGRKQSWRK